MDIVSANLISSSYPGNFDSDISTSTNIQISFVRDMDATTFNLATIALELVGTISRIPLTIAYSNKILNLTPTSDLSPNSTYKLTIVGDDNPVQDYNNNTITGIKDILGNGMIGNFEITFTTNNEVPLQPPHLLNPAPQSSVLSGSPVFNWTASVGASGYQIQVATNNTFEDIVWPQDPWNWSTGNITVSPGSVLTSGNEFWWRVRSSNASGYSSWGPAYNFYYGDPTQGYVSPQDNPFGLEPPGVNVPKILSTFPIANSNNLLPPQWPDKIVMRVNFPVNQGDITKYNFSVEGIPIEGIFNASSFKPIFSPSLNGAIYQSGGITAPAPVDAYQQILASGPMDTSGGAEVVTDSDNNSVISIDVPDGYLQNNNIYVVRLSLPQLTNPVKFTFTTQWFPLFSAVSTIRITTDHFLPNIADEEILFHIRRNSLNSIFLQVFPPTQMDGDEWFYQPPVSFDVNNPPYFVREYVRLQTSRDFLMSVMFGLLKAGRITLGDLTVDQEKTSLKAAAEYAIAQIDKELAPFLDKLHGHTARGWARGDWAQRGERIKNWADSGGYPFGGRPFRF